MNGMTSQKYQEHVRRLAHGKVVKDDEGYIRGFVSKNNKREFSLHMFALFHSPSRGWNQRSGFINKTFPRQMDALKEAQDIISTFPTKKCWECGEERGHLWYCKNAKRRNKDEQ